MCSILVTLEVPKLSNGWLKEVAPKNMYSMFSTLEVSKLANGELKAAALRNISLMLVAWEVCHPEMSGLHVVLSLKRPSKFDTHETPQVVMGP